MSGSTPNPQSNAQRQVLQEDEALEREGLLHLGASWQHPRHDGEQPLDSTLVGYALRTTSM